MLNASPLVDDLILNHYTNDGSKYSSKCSRILFTEVVSTPARNKNNSSIDFLSLFLPFIIAFFFFLVVFIELQEFISRLDGSDFPDSPLLLASPPTTIFICSNLWFFFSMPNTF